MTALSINVQKFQARFCLTPSLGVQQLFQKFPKD